MSIRQVSLRATLAGSRSRPMLWPATASGAAATAAGHNTLLLRLMLLL